MFTKKFGHHLHSQTTAKSLNFSCRSFYVELMCSIIVGVIPSCIGLLFFGVEGAFTFVDNIIGDNFNIFGYLIFIAILSKLIETNGHSWLSILKCSYNTKYFFIELSNRIGMTILGIYRAFAGGIFTVGTAVLWQQFTAQDAFLVGASFLFALGCLWFTTIMQPVGIRTENPIQS